MQIVVNARHLRKGKLDGIGWFSYQILKRITQNNPDVHFIFLFDRNFDEEFIFSENITPIILSPPARHPILFYVWNHISVNNLLKKLRPDLYISTDGMIPLHAPCKTISVIHDINFKHNPSDLPYLTSKFYNLFYPKYAKLASRVISVSEFSKNDIAQSFSLPMEKIEIVYNGINEGFYKLDLKECENIRAEYSKACPYFIYVGSLHTRKNIIRLLKAFELFKSQHSSNHKLFLVGSIFWGRKEINKQLDSMKHADDVVFTGRVDNKKLNELLNAATALTFVPYFEGFGIPIIEAMQVDLPVICSNVTSMPEVAADSAYLVNPYSETEIATAMKDLAFDEVLRKKLIENGQKRRKDFSWDKSSHKFWNIVEDTLKNNENPI